MDSLPDQFLFVNKSAGSGSLSHSDPDEGFFIHSHVHRKYHKQRRQTRQRSLLSNLSTSGGRATSSSASNKLKTTGGSKETRALITNNAASEQKSPKEDISDVQEKSHCRLGHSATPKEIDIVAIDPFYCTSAALDAKDQRLLFYPFTSFVETTFNAESLSWMTSPTGFRHREAVVQRLRRCVVDELTMYSTLAYCASCIRWAIGEKERERPPEYYVLKAIEALKKRLEQADIVDTWLILSIYSLATSEMWAQNYGAATAHLKMTRHFVTQIGGLNKLDPYLMEGILLCNKYVAIGRFEVPIFSLDWEPGPLPAQEMRSIQLEVENPLSDLAQGFFDLDERILGPRLLHIIEDIRICALVSQRRETQKIGDSSDQHWLFLRHQANCCHLLSLKTSSEVQACCRLALIVWLLKITGYFGAQRWSKRLLPDLKAALLRLDHAGEWCPLVLMFWMTSLGAMTAEYTDERDWFLKRTINSAKSLGIELDKEAFRCVLKKFLFLKSEDGLQFFRMVRAARELEEET